MAKTLTVSSMRYSIGYNATKDDDLGGLTQNSATYFRDLPLTNGTGAKQANLIGVRAGTIAGGGTVSVDLAGSLVDFFGDTITMARVKALIFELTGGTGTHAYLKPAATNGWAGATRLFNADTDRLYVRNPGFVAVACEDATAYLVTAGTADILEIVNADATNSLTYRLLVVGSSA